MCDANLTRLLCFRSVFFRQGWLENNDENAVRGASRLDDVAYRAFLGDEIQRLFRLAEQGDQWAIPILQLYSQPGW